MKRTVILLSGILALALPGLTAAEDGARLDGERVFIVNDYRYEPGQSDGDPDLGHSICATRCNALSVDYRNYIDPGGWRVIKVASDREVFVGPGNPFIGGQCVCTADEYVIQLNEFNRPNSAPRK